VVERTGLAHGDDASIAAIRVLQEGSRPPGAAITSFASQTVEGDSGSGLAPENTIVAYENGLALGADGEKVE